MHVADPLGGSQSQLRHEKRQVHAKSAGSFNSAARGRVPESILRNRRFPGCKRSELPHCHIITLLVPFDSAAMTGPNLSGPPGASAALISLLLQQKASWMLSVAGPSNMRQFACWPSTGLRRTQAKGMCETCSIAFLALSNPWKFTINGVRNCRILATKLSWRQR